MESRSLKISHFLTLQDFDMQMHTVHPTRGEPHQSSYLGHISTSGGQDEQGPVSGRGVGEQLTGGYRAYTERAYKAFTCFNNGQE